MERKNIFIILGILVAVVLLTVGILALFSSPTLSTLLGEEFIPIKINNNDVSCISNQDCKDVIMNKFPSATNFDVVCLNEICSIKAIKSDSEKVK